MLMKIIIKSLICFRFLYLFLWDQIYFEVLRIYQAFQPSSMNVRSTEAVALLIFGFLSISSFTSGTSVLIRPDCLM